MDLTHRNKIQEFIVGLLRNKDDNEAVGDAESLFVGGRLDSLSAVEVVSFLEETFGIDFSDMDFEIEKIDSIDAIGALVTESNRA